MNPEQAQPHQTNSKESYPHTPPTPPLVDDGDDVENPSSATFCHSKTLGSPDPDPTTTTTTAPRAQNPLEPGYLAAQLRDLGFIGAWQWLKHQDLELVAITIAEVQALLSTPRGRHIHNPAGLIRAQIEGNTRQNQEVRPTERENIITIDQARTKRRNSA